MLVARQAVLDRRRQLTADDDVRAFVGVLVPHVHEAHRRQRTIEHARVSDTRAYLPDTAFW